YADALALIESPPAWLEAVEQCYDRVRVELEEPVRDEDPVGAAVTLDLALIGAELRIRREPLVKRAGRDLLHRLEDRFGVAVEADAQLMAGVADSCKEPVIGRAAADQISREWPDELAQHPVGDGRACVQLQVGPFGAGWERAAYVVVRARQAHGRRGLGSSTHEGDDQLDRAVPVLARGD